jgi:hypothetical protein
MQVVGERPKVSNTQLNKDIFTYCYGMPNMLHLLATVISSMGQKYDNTLVA